MLDLLKSAQARRVLYWTTVWTAVFLLAAQYVASWLLDKEHNLANAGLVTIQVVTTGLFGGVAATAFITFLTRFLLRHERKLRQTEVIDSLTSQRAHLKAIDKTTFWHHNGHIGLWVRTRVLPRFGELAPGSTFDRTVKFLLIDPMNVELVKRYAEHRRQVDAVDDDVDTRTDTQIEVLTTIVQAAHFEQHVAGVRAQVFLRQNLDLFRVDTLEKRSFTTLSRKESPALLYRHDIDDGDHYNAASINFDVAIRSAKQVDVEGVVIAKNPTLDELTMFIENVGFPELVGLSQDVMKRSRSKVNRTS